MQQLLPFATKELANGKKLYKRIIGVQQLLSIGDNDIIYTVSHDWVKITGLEIVGSTPLDKASLYILDTASGTYSSVPNAQLNQFGFSINLPPDFYEHKSEYDADLYKDMQIKVVYNSTTTKTVGINFILNEVK